MYTPIFDDSYAKLPSRLFELVTPDCSPAPKLITLNAALANEMGLDADCLGSDAGLAMMSGGKMPKGANPIAMVYGGHQFGHWSGRLGDGRACLLGEIVGPDKVRRDLVLKGCGPTAYSRNGDGKSALGPVLREYIVSEAMAAYGIPTTRALAAVLTGEQVRREQDQPGGILVRVAKSHVRVGTFQYLYASGDMEGLKELADYVIARHYPKAALADNPILELLQKIMEGQASLIAGWMGLGFIHGVMNTDNMQIAGETLDYGPCAFMDDFHPGKVFSSIDHHGRYGWGKQPQMALWNLTQLGQALSPLIDEDESKSASLVQDTLSGFGAMFQADFQKVFAAKFGLDNKEDKTEFLQSAFNMMAEQEVDFTLFFRQLTSVAMGGDRATFYDLFKDDSVGKNWLKQFEISDKNLTTMQAANPIYIPRNHQIEQAIQDGVEGDFTLFHRLAEVLKTPYTAQENCKDLEAAPAANEIVTQTFCGT